MYFSGNTEPCVCGSPPFHICQRVADPINSIHCPTYPYILPLLGSKFSGAATPFSPPPFRLITFFSEGRSSLSSKIIQSDYSSAGNRSGSPLLQPHNHYTTLQALFRFFNTGHFKLGLCAKGCHKL